MMTGSLMRQTEAQAFDISLRRFWALGGWGLIVTVIMLSLLPMPSPKLGFILFDNIDKMEHALTYATLTLWFAQICPKCTWARIGLKLLTLGVIIELLQGVTTYRNFSFWDIGANTLGILIGWSLSIAGLSRALAYLENKLVSRQSNL
jgi:VanZ family protein